MDKLEKLKAAYQKCVDDMQAILDSTEAALTEEQQKSFDVLKAEAESLKTQIANLEQLLTAQAEAKRLADAPASVLPRQVKPDAVIVDPNAGPTTPKQIMIPAEAKRWASGTLRAFKGENAAENAYASGMWLAAIMGNRKAEDWCNEHGIEAVYQETGNTTGGYLVPTVLSPAIIELVKEYGVFRNHAGVIPMISDTLNIPRRTGGLDAHFVGEGGAGTESTGSWDLVSLIAKDLMVLTRVSNDLIGDAIIPIMDRITVEIARAIATKEDACGFLGDGTSTYGGITGVLPRLTTVAWTAPSVNAGSGLKEWSTGAAFSDIVIGDLLGCLALCPKYALAGAKWHCSPTFFAAVMLRLALVQGGATSTEMEKGITVPQFLGYPVILNNTMNILGVDQIISLLFGDLSQACSFGDRQQITLATSSEATIGGQSMFERNQQGIRAVTRFDINVHDVGSSSAPGPIVGLMCYDAA